MANYRVRLIRGDELTCHKVEERKFGITLIDGDGTDIGFVPNSILEEVEQVDK